MRGALAWEGAWVAGPLAREWAKEETGVSFHVPLACPDRAETQEIPSQRRRSPLSHGSGAGQKQNRRSSRRVQRILLGEDLGEMGDEVPEEAELDLLLEYAEERDVDEERDGVGLLAGLVERLHAERKDEEEKSGASAGSGWDELDVVAKEASSVLGDLRLEAVGARRGREENAMKGMNEVGRRTGEGWMRTRGRP